jgi:co-chaperonin GroES (HSP10)
VNGTVYYFAKGAECPTYKGEPMNQDIPILNVPVEQLDIKAPGRGMLYVERVDSMRTAGGLVIPEQSREKQMARWRVLSIGAPHLLGSGKEIAPGVAVGDEVLLSPNAGKIFELPQEAGETKRVVCDEAAVIATVRARHDA